MADANHSATVLFPNRFVMPHAAFEHRRTIPHLRLTDMAPPERYLSMKLSGRWIEAAGFDPGQRLRIEVSHRRLVITPIDESDCDSFERERFPEPGPATANQQQPLSPTTGNAR
ncbi:SymE family type I addiction module toxin [Burkholderia arboris]|uniref:SymE family type I addiction module toxin n=1 Tax=Burkholderia arboris TaxID=488730 RepID=UPI00210AF65F|nr:SymE family type I addiction module toxin [Burkholderia arboris]UTV58746.1 SymE family type I addiction module toxin [Burkholderia arboris]